MLKVASFRFNKEVDSLALENHDTLDCSRAVVETREVIKQECTVILLGSITEPSAQLSQLENHQAHRT